MDDGLPDSLQLDIDEGTAGNTALDALAMQPAPESADTSFGATFSDRSFDPLPESAAETAATPAAITAMAPSTPINKLPAIGWRHASLKPPIGQSYPSTGNKIDIPDPESVSFDPSEGSKFDPNREAKTNLKSLAPPVSAGEIVDSWRHRISHADRRAACHSSFSRQQPGDRGLTNAFSIADRQYAKDRLKEALATLSVFYNAPNASPAQRRRAAWADLTPSLVK